MPIFAYQRGVGRHGQDIITRYFITTNISGNGDYWEDARPKRPKPEGPHPEA